MKSSYHNRGGASGRLPLAFTNGLPTGSGGTPSCGAASRRSRSPSTSPRRSVSGSIGGSGSAGGGYGADGNGSCGSLVPDMNLLRLQLEGELRGSITSQVRLGGVLSREAWARGVRVPVTSDNKPSASCSRVASRVGSVKHQS